jgi:hypothetical protein
MQVVVRMAYDCAQWRALVLALLSTLRRQALQGQVKKQFYLPDVRYAPSSL